MRGTRRRIIHAVVGLVTVGAAACGGGGTKPDAGGESFGPPASDVRELPTSGGGASGGSTANSPIGITDHGVQVVESKLFTSPENGHPETQDVAGTIVVTNTTTSAIGRVGVIFSFVNANGTEVDSESDFLTFLQPGEKGFMVGHTDVPSSNPVTDFRLALEADTTSYSDHEHRFPVRDIHVDRGDLVGAKGSMTNDLSKPVNEAEIVCVFRDSQGGLLIGTSTYSAEVAPGATVPFNATLSNDEFPNAASAECRAATTAGTTVG